MNQYLNSSNVLAWLSIVVRTAYQLKPHCTELARSLFVLTEYISSIININDNLTSHVLL